MQEERISRNIPEYSRAAIRENLTCIPPKAVIDSPRSYPMMNDSYPTAFSQPHSLAVPYSAPKGPPANIPKYSLPCIPQKSAIQSIRSHGTEPMNQNSNPTTHMNNNSKDMNNNSDSNSNMNNTPDYTKCPASYEHAVELYADLIEKESRTYFNMARKSSYMIGLEDVIQQGLSTLLRVLERYDPEHNSGSSFRNYLKSALQHDLMGSLRAIASFLSIPSENIKKLYRAYRLFQQEGGNPQNFTAKEFHRLMPDLSEDICKHTFEAWSMIRNVAPGLKAGDAHEMRDADGLNCISREQAFGDTDDNPATIVAKNEILHHVKIFLESGTEDERIYKKNLAGEISDAEARAVLGISQPTFRKRRKSLRTLWREQLSKLDLAFGA